MTYTPPDLWKQIILTDVKIMYYGASQLKSISVSKANASARRNDFLGLYLPTVDTIVYPQLVDGLPWGNSTSANYSNAPELESVNGYKGLNATIGAYNGDAASRTNDCAIGYVQNFERYSNGKGIGKRKWYLPCIEEAKKVLLPYYHKLKYAASLLGFEWGDASDFWLCYDFAKVSAYYYTTSQGTQNGSGKGIPHRVIMFAERPTTLDTQPS